MACNSTFADLKLIIGTHPFYAGSDNDLYTPIQLQKLTLKKFEGFCKKSSFLGQFGGTISAQVARLSDYWLRKMRHPWRESRLKIKHLALVISSSVPKIGGCW